MSVPGPCLWTSKVTGGFPECQTTAILEAGRPGGVKVYCPRHAAQLRANPIEAEALRR